MGVTVREKPKGSGVWWVFVNFKSQRRAKLVGSGPRNKRLAEDLATKIKARLLDGNVADLEAARPEPTKAVTFADLANSWSGWYQGLYPTRFNTRRNSESVIRAHLLPHFGAMPMSSITRPVVQAFIASRRAKLADSTLRVYQSTLSLVLDYAVEQGYLASNPTRGARLWRPEPKGDAADPFTQDELVAIVQAAEGLAPAFGLLVRAWAQSGMRSGELRGLRRGDLETGAGTVQVQRTLTHRRFGPPKTAQSKRTASLIFPVCEPVPGWEPTPESRSVMERLARVVPLSPDAPLFGSLADAGKPMHEPELWRWWQRTMARAKVRPRGGPENLRHTCISLLLSRGAPFLMVAAQAGHSPSMMLKSYARWLQPTATQVQPAAEPASKVGAVSRLRTR